MSARMKVVVRILMLIAKFVADDEAAKKDVESLASHLQYSGNGL